MWQKNDLDMLSINSESTIWEVPHVLKFLDYRLLFLRAAGELKKKKKIVYCYVIVYESNSCIHLTFDGLPVPKGPFPMIRFSRIFTLQEKPRKNV